MLQKFNITTYAVVLCLFGFMLFTAAPVFADPQGEFDDCKAMKWSEGKKDKKNCYKDLAEELIERIRDMKISHGSNIESSNNQLCDALEEITASTGVVLGRRVLVLNEIEDQSMIFSHEDIINTCDM